MRLKDQNEMEGFWPHAATGPVERMVRPQFGTFRQAPGIASQSYRLASVTDSFGSPGRLSSKQPAEMPISSGSAELYQNSVDPQAVQKCLS